MVDGREHTISEGGCAVGFTERMGRRERRRRIYERPCLLALQISELLSEIPKGRRGGLFRVRGGAVLLSISDDKMGEL